MVDMCTERIAGRHDELRFPPSLPTVLTRLGALVATVVAGRELAWVLVFARDVVVGLGPVASDGFVLDGLWAIAVFALLLTPLVLAAWWTLTGIRRRSGWRVLGALGAVGTWPLLLVLPPVWALGWLVA